MNKLFVFGLGIAVLAAVLVLPGCFFKRGGEEKAVPPPPPPAETKPAEKAPAKQEPAPEAQVPELAIDSIPSILTAPLARVSGTARRFVVGKHQAEVGIRREGDKHFWNGSEWAAQAKFLPPKIKVEGDSGVWSLDLDGADFRTGQRYTVIANALGLEGAKKEAATASFTYQAHRLVLLNHDVAVPNKVRFVFSLRDVNGEAVVRPINEIRAGLKVFEEGRELDADVSGVFLAPVTNVEMNVVFVFDLTLRTLKAGGVQPTLDAVSETIGRLGWDHRIAIVEYHDRSEAPQVLQPFTSNRDRIMTVLQSLQDVPVASGSSRVWDAVSVGLKLFPPNSNALGALIVVSNGEDLSSATRPSQLIADAKKQNIQLYTVGFDQAVSAPVLAEMAAETGGVHVEAPDRKQLVTQLRKVGQHLSGQILMSFISMSPKQTIVVQVRLNVGEHEARFTHRVDKGRAEGDDRVGRITFDAPVADGQKTSVSVRAFHIPREVNSLRFKVESTRAVEPPELIPRDQGGLLDGWDVSGPDTGGFYTLVGSDSLPFGASGLLFRLTFSGNEGQESEARFQIENTLYKPGVRFVHPPRMGLKSEPR